jgi:hypothetical protein
LVQDPGLKHTVTVIELFDDDDDDDDNYDDDYDSNGNIVLLQERKTKTSRVIIILWHQPQLQSPNCYLLQKVPK